MKCTTEEQRIAARYKRFGVTADIVAAIVNDGIESGMTQKASLLGARYVLSKVYNQQEYFTAEDVAEITGESVEEVNRRIEENKDELIKNGGIATIAFATDIKQ